MPTDTQNADTKVSGNLTLNLVPGSYKIIRDQDGNITDFQDITFEGIASAWNRDIAGDKFEMGTYPQDVIDQYMTNPVICINHCHHEMDQVAGRITTLTNTPQGLLCAGMISNAEDIKSLRFKIVEGVLRSLSICGVSRKQGGIDVFKRIDEISIVDMPCNPACQFVLKAKTLGDSRKASEKLAASAESEDALIKKSGADKMGTAADLKQAATAFVDSLNQFLGEEEQEPQHKEEAAKKKAAEEEAKAKEAKEKEEAEAKAKESDEKECKCKKESDEEKKKGLDMETKKETAEELEAKQKALDDKLGQAVEQKLKLILPGYMEGNAPAIIHGFSSQVKALPKPQREFSHWMQSHLDNGTGGKFELDMGCENKETLNAMLSVSQDENFKKSLGTAMVMPDGRVVGNRQFYDYGSQEKAVRKALDGTSTGGADMTFQEISNLLFMRLYGQAVVSPKFIQVPMQSSTMKHSEVWAQLNIMGRAAQTGTGLESSPYTHSDIVTAQDFIGVTYVYDNVAQDSVFNLTSMVQQVMAVFVGRKLDSAIINGDDSATHMDCASVAAHWGATSGNDYQPVEFYWKGLRYYAINTAGLYTDLATLGSSKAGLDAVVSKMGKYATYDPSNALVIVGSKAHAKLRTDAAYAAALNAGPLWTLKDGKVKEYMGSEVVESFDMPEDQGTNGLFGAAAAAYGSVIGVNKTQFAVGLRKSMVFEILRDPTYFRSIIRCHARFGFLPYETPSADQSIVSIGYGAAN